jgi:hypothetical protein
LALENNKCMYVFLIHSRGSINNNSFPRDVYPIVCWISAASGKKQKNEGKVLKEDRRVEEMKILIEGHMIARPQVVKHITMKESPGTTVKLLPCNHDMRSWAKSWKQPLVEM